MAACFGGLSKYEQLKELRAGSEVMVGTPGRIIDLIKMKACNMRRVTYLVLDEADRMFDMGFEPQVIYVAFHFVKQPGVCTCMASPEIYPLLLSGSLYHGSNTTKQANAAFLCNYASTRGTTCSGHIVLTNKNNCWFSWSS